MKCCFYSQTLIDVETPHSKQWFEKKKKGKKRETRTSAKTHLFEQSLLSGRVQHKLVKAGVGWGLEGPQRLCGLLDPETQMCCCVRLTVQQSFIKRQDTNSINFNCHKCDDGKTGVSVQSPVSCCQRGKRFPDYPERLMEISRLMAGEEMA